MRCIIFLIFLSVSNNAFSKILQSQIDSIDLSLSKDSPHLILLNNGEVVFLSEEHSDFIDSLESARSNKAYLKFNVDENNNFISVLESNFLLDTENDTLSNSSISSNDKLYTPSILSNLNNGFLIFYKMRTDYQYNSQCYNRAHIWAYEENRRSGLRSKKYFLFFTRKYIRNYRFKWWFHVSPAIVVNGMGDQIIDRRYTSGLRSPNRWTNYFVYSRRSCPVVFKYSTYRNNQDTQDCYLIPVSMYFWQPRDILRRDQTGFEKKIFYSSEISHAYWEAF